jgi:membrane protein implicated in regulation of membrane protease activity
MKEIIPYIWIGIIIFAAVAELHTLALVSVWFVAAGIIAFIFSLAGMEVWLQVLLFFIITSILLILSRTIFKKFIKFKSESTNVDSLIGKTAIVTEEINNLKSTGEIRINGVLWTARAEDDDIIYETGLVVTISAIEGVKAICTR